MKIKKAKSTIIFEVITYALLAIGSIVCVFPFIIILSGSFTDNTTILTQGYSILPRDFTLSAYETIFRAPKDILQAYKMTLYYTLVGTGVGLVIITLTAYVISRKEFKYRNQVSFLIYFTSIFGGGMIPWYLMYANVLNLKGSTFAIWFPALMSPFLIILMRTFIVGSVPDAITESAKIDGAGHVTIFVKIVMPVLGPGLATVGLFLALGYWNDWYRSSMFSTNSQTWELQFYLYDLLNATTALKQMTQGTGITTAQLPTESVKLAMAVVATGPILLASAMVLTMAGCGNSKSAADAMEDVSPAETQETEGDTSNDEQAPEEASAAEDSTEATPAEAAELDTSERVDLVFYVMGDAPDDEQMVEDAINEVLLERVNATIDMQFSTWTVFQQKYSLELTAGSADLIYIANWLNYGQLATSGAFEELDGMLDSVAPELKKVVGETNLDMCRVDGKIYAVPCAWAEYVCNGIKYREDLRAKYDLPVPDSIENFETYMLGIQENEPNQGLLTVTTEESQGFLTAFDAAWIFNLKYPWVNANGLPYGLASNYDSTADVYDYWYSDDFVEDMHTMKKWADLGFWSKSALSDTNNSESYKNGLCVAEIAGQNPNKQITAISDFKNDGHDDWQSEYIAYGEITNTIYPGHATQNGTAIVRGCKNPERALKVLEILMTDEEMNRLIQYGIEGVHYEIDDQGIYHNLNDAHPTFAYEGFNTWALRNGEFKLPQETDVILNEMFDKYEKLGEQTKFPNVNIYNGFSENYDDYQAERTAVSNIMKQYLAPLQAGLVDDVDAAVEEFRQKMTDAGIEACREGFKEQWAAYCDEYGYK